MDVDRGVWTIARVAGLDVKVHWSWILITLLLTFTLAVGYFPHSMPGASTLTYWVLGWIASLMLFVSVLLHELSHSFTAIARGYRVRDIVLFIFGGVSNIEEEPKKPGDEFLIAVVGPLASFVLAAVFWVALQLITPP